MNKDEILKAVCQIKGPSAKGEGTYAGQGVFISPGHVLTALHIAQGIDIQRLYIKASNGERSEIAIGGTLNVSDEKLDLAILSLRRPISDDFAIVANPPSSPFLDEVRSIFGRRDVSDIEGHLATKFGNEGKCHKVTLSSLERFEKFPNVWGQDLVKYDCDIVAREGYSGSPIIDNEGRVISILSASLETALSPSFLAPDPVEFARFYNRQYLGRNLD